MTEAPNGRYKWVAAALGMGMVGLLGWNLAAIPNLQAENASRLGEIKALNERVDRLRIDLDYLRQAFTNNEADTRTALATAQQEQRAAATTLLKTLTEIQVQIASYKDGKH